jgi:hypothetical protein
VDNADRAGSLAFGHSLGQELPWQKVTAGAGRSGGQVQRIAANIGKLPDPLKKRTA